MFSTYTLVPFSFLVYRSQSRSHRFEPFRQSFSFWHGLADGRIVVANTFSLLCASGITQQWTHQIQVSRCCVFRSKSRSHRFEPFRQSFSFWNGQADGRIDVANTFSLLCASGITQRWTNQIQGGKSCVFGSFYHLTGLKLRWHLGVWIFERIV